MTPFHMLVYRLVDQGAATIPPPPLQPRYSVFKGKGVGRSEVSEKFIDVGGGLVSDDSFMGEPF